MRRSRLFRELLIFLVFSFLTVLMTWPWALHIRDAITEPGDQYAHAYFLWWDYFQTFHDPLNLFHATVFYPYRYTLAFSENDYGIALLFFPLFALGLRPLTIEGVATLAGFAFTGYGAFRLARTLTASNIAAWVAGVIFAFIPYRFNQLAHLPLIFTGWMPLLLEALVLFARERSWTRAAWLGVAFLMNALTCLTWFALTIIPLGLSALLLLIHHRIWRAPAFWTRGGMALGVASLALTPFLFPYYKVSRLYGFTRNTGEVAYYSARPINWLAMEGQNRLWHGLGGSAIGNEMVLFPGFLPLLLTLAALLLVKAAPYHGHAPVDTISPSAQKTLPVFLDALALSCLVVALLAIGYEGFKLRLFGFSILSASKPTRALVLLAIALSIRCYLKLPEILHLVKRRDLLTALRSSRRYETLAHGLLWAIIGFFGSFGLNSFFHRTLYNSFLIFQGMRVATRWAMICYLGLALLAGLGAGRVAEALARHRPRLRMEVTCAIIVLAILFELRAAPLKLFKGDVDPDPLTIRLKKMAMGGGIVEIPSTTGGHLYMLRAADHAQPLVTATGSHIPPVEQEIEMLTRGRPIPGRFLDLLEVIPASYLVVHNGSLYPESRVAVESFLAQGVAAGRLRFIRSYGDRKRNDLYAITKTEPAAQSEALPPSPFSLRESKSQLEDLPAEFGDAGYLIYRFYRASYGRMPKFVELTSDAQRIRQGVETGSDEKKRLENSTQTFSDDWVERVPFKTTFDSKNNEQYVDALFANAGMIPGPAERDALVDGLRDGRETRSSVIRKVVNNEKFMLKEFNRAYVLILYFAYLRRDPDEGGYDHWLGEVNNDFDSDSMIRVFTSSEEYENLSLK